MISSPRFLTLLALVLAGAASRSSAEDAPASPVAAPNPALPTIFIAGDSTAQPGEPNAVGWGKMFGDYFDPAKVNIVNRAIGGRSSRTFVSEGRWERLVNDLRPGDVVLIQFGQNDGAERNGERIARGSLNGLGEETEEIDNKVTKQHEIVHTFGWYMRKMIGEAKAKGALPVVVTQTVRDLWKDGRVERGSGQYNLWDRQLAEAEKVPFVDLTKLVADRYEQLGREAANAFFPRDFVHTDEDGARFNAYYVVSGLKGLREQSIIRTLSLSGRMVPTAVPSDVWVPTQPPPRGGGGGADSFAKWLNLPEIADPKLPTVLLIGDSTVRNGRGNGYDGQFGWGDPLEKYFFPSKANVLNRAVGGTGARTFQAQWKNILPLVKSGDVVLIQFGHNDNGARGALKGIGEETQEVENPATKAKETVHTFGWYLRSYIADIRAKGATPVLCTLVPRNNWTDGRITRTPDTHADWTRAVGKTEDVPVLDLNELLGRRYDALGQEATTALFADKTTHTTWAGAEMSAQVVVEALRALPKNPVAAFLRSGM
ncbi:MAG TPA: rhamnogalacturonan acetylesterase [Opitutaceae bacterium]|nr:rhamnogalacturonan acetylesterase [Opitutaceae bacterium]